ncbi:MAG TPA: APC family permease [Gemmatimonadaceae bacterium]|nr:APC family permease [Gemmatimonadaceae bacterium]
MIAGIRRVLLGRRLRTDEHEEQKIGPLSGVPVLGLDALASASYGPEAALTVLLPLGVFAPHYMGPLSAVIIGLLVIVYLSYRQTIAAYPDGGGSYSVASRNLGRGPGLLAASALAVDYILNVAVAISAGAGAIISAFPGLQPYTLAICMALLVLIATVNLRGVREAGLLWMIPTYAFVVTLGLTIGYGVIRTLTSGGDPVPVRAPPTPLAATGTVAGLWLLMHAFASGCTAMTGVEAVSNGVPIFREPRAKMARRTLTSIIAILIMLLAGIAFLANAYGISATRPGTAGYESVLSQLVGAVWGRGPMYFVTLASIVCVLALSANTSFADFPRLCRVLALDDYLPAEFAHLGRRLVYSTGIVILAVLSGALLVAFGGVTDRLIPLFAVGAFLAFTLSQAGMVAHWRREGDGSGRVRRSMLLNGCGAVATGVTLLVIIVAKFTEGAWLAVVVVPAFVLLFSRIRRFNESIDREVEVDGPLQLDDPPPPVIVVPLKRLDRVGRKALRLAASMSPEVHVLHILTQEPNMDPLRARWREYVELPFAQAGITPPRLVEIASEYREFFDPVLQYVRRLGAENPRRYVGVFVPELVEHRWYHFLLHSHRATLLKGLLLLRGGPQVVIINAPWHLRDRDPAPAPPSTASYARTT